MSPRQRWPRQNWARELKLQQKVNLRAWKKLFFLGVKITTLKNLEAKSVIKPNDINCFPLYFSSYPLNIIKNKKLSIYVFPLLHMPRIQRH